MAIFIASLALIASIGSFVYLRALLIKRTESNAFIERRDAVINEIDRITDRDGELVARRVEQLKKILDEADERIVLLNREFDEYSRGSAAYLEIGRKKNVRSPPPAEPRHEAPLEAANAVVSREPEPTEVPMPPAEVNTELPISDKIVLLYSEGLDHARIASKLHITIARVEMVLALRGLNG